MELSKSDNCFLLSLTHQEKNVLTAALMERLASDVINDDDAYLEDIMALQFDAIAARQGSLLVGFQDIEHIEQFIVSPLRQFSDRVNEKRTGLVKRNTETLGAIALSLVQGIEEADVYRRRGDKKE